MGRRAKRLVGLCPRSPDILRPCTEDSAPMGARAVGGLLALPLDMAVGGELPRGMGREGDRRSMPVGA